MPTLPGVLIPGLLAAALPAAAAAQVRAIDVCEPDGAARPICGFQNPEDLVALPGGEAILVSEYGGMEGDTPGGLALLVIESEERRELFRGGDADGAQPAWGDPACPGPPPPAFSPHGIHLAERADGALQLLAVQHGGRESIEFFEVSGAGRDWRVVWRGCVVAPADAWLNSVAALPGGGFVTTRMMTRPPGGEDLLTALGRGDGPGPGYVLEWLPERGFEILGGSEVGMPNGIETSADGRFVFVNGGGQVRRIVRATGQAEASAPLGGLDNARWAPDGRLVVASIEAGGPDELAFCMRLERGACPIGFRIVAVDPVSLETDELYRNQGPPMGGGTIGLVVGDELFVGSFAGDRILRVALD